MFLGFALIWMISGTLVTEEEIIETYVEKESTVRVIDQTSQNFTREILIKGFAEADKKVELKAETSGRVIALPISQGSRVKEGDPICSIFMAEKESFLKKLNSNLNLHKSFLMKDCILQINFKTSNQILKELNLNSITRQLKLPFLELLTESLLMKEIF